MDTDYKGELRGLICVIILLIVLLYVYNIDVYIKYKETPSLRCAGTNAIGCTTIIIPGYYYLIEYVPETQRCHTKGCITINDTIEHELNHVNQSLIHGYMWEV